MMGTHCMTFDLSLLIITFQPDCNCFDAFELRHVFAAQEYVMMAMVAVDPGHNHHHLVQHLLDCHLSP